MVEEVNGLRVRPKDVESLKAVRKGRFFVERKRFSFGGGQARKQCQRQQRQSAIAE